MKVIETFEFTVPTFYLPALINGDHTGLSDREVEALSSFYKKIVEINDIDYPESTSFTLSVPDEDNEPAFSRFHDLHGISATDCQQVIMTILGE